MVERQVDVEVIETWEEVEVEGKPVLGSDKNLHGLER